MAQHLPWLADAARLTGYPVVELVGWRGHNHGPMADHIFGTMCHHTAGPDPYPGASNDFPSIGIVRNGRPGLPGPLAQYGLGWNGTVYIVSDGLAYHAGEGSWRGVSGNSRFLGIEAEDAGDGDWTPAQLDAYPRLAAAIQDYLGQDAGWVCAHREYAPRRKIDPAGIDMPAFRGAVDVYLANPHLLRRSEVDLDARQDRLLAELHAQLCHAWHNPGPPAGPGHGWPVEMVADSHREQTVAYDWRHHHNADLDRQYGHVLAIRHKVNELAEQLNIALDRLESQESPPLP